MSIRLRLTAVFTLAALILVTVGGVVFVLRLRAGMERNLDQSLHVRAGAIGAALSVDAAARLPNNASAFAQVYAPDGRLLRSSSAVADARLLTVAEATAVHDAGSGGEAHLNRRVDVRTGNETDTETLRVYALDTTVAGTGEAVLAVAADRSLVDDTSDQTTMQIVVFGVALLALAVTGSWLLARAALRPVDRMRARAEELDAANAAAGVPVPDSRDEIARLGNTFNALLTRLHAAIERERSFVADAGHELRTPLTVLKGEFELARRAERSREELRETVDIAAEETDRLIRLAENLLSLAREEHLVQTPVDLADVARDALRAAAPAAAARGVSLRLVDGGEPGGGAASGEASGGPDGESSGESTVTEPVGVVTGDEDRLRQALDNLVTNALRYAPDGGAVVVQLARTPGEAVIEVSDDGPGFPPEFLPHAFERFARADTARGRADGGNGLGLAIVAAIMTGHGGTATAANTADHGGAIVTLRWPQPPPV